MTARKKAAANGAGRSDWTLEQFSVAADALLREAARRRGREQLMVRHQAAKTSADIQRDAKEAAMKAIRDGDGPAVAAEVLANGVAAAWQLEIGAGL
jgi:hypothetical protein